MKSNRKHVLLLSAVVALATTGTANAAGCLKGALVGGVAGHYAGHHALVGAAGGCLVGHELAKKQAREKKEAKLRTQQTQAAQVQ